MRRRPAGWVACALVALAGCATDAEKISAIGAVNEGFRTEYEKLLQEKGTRVYKVGRNDAFVAMRVALAGLGMQTEQQDSTLGHLAVAAPAPRPLTDDEWRAATPGDRPRVRRRIAPPRGAAGCQAPPVDDVLPSTGDGTAVSLTVRLREIAPPRSGWPRREYVAPQVLRVGLDKIFAAFERELRTSPRA